MYPILSHVIAEEIISDRHARADHRNLVRQARLAKRQQRAARPQTRTRPGSKPCAEAPKLREA